MQKIYLMIYMYILSKNLPKIIKILHLAEEGVVMSISCWS